MLSDGEIDPVALLYSNENLPSYPSTIEGVNQGNPYNITYRGQWNDYNITGGYWTQSVGLDSAALPILLPSVLGNMLAVEAGDEMKVQVADENDLTMRAVVRGLATQFPGFYFTDYMSTFIAVTAGQYGV